MVSVTSRVTGKKRPDVAASPLARSQLLEAWLEAPFRTNDLSYRLPIYRLVRLRRRRKIRLFVVV